MKAQTLVLASIAGFLSLPTSAADKTWVGGNGSWTDDSKWNPAGAPSPADHAVINTGTVTNEAAVTIDRLTLNGGTLTGSGSFVVTHFAWGNGDLGGTNSFRIPAGGTWSLPGNGSRDILARTVTLEGTCTFTGSGSLRFRNGSGVHNLGTLDIQGDGDFTHFGGGGILRNSGTFRKSGGTGPTAIGGGILFTNTGTVELQSGSLQIAGTGGSSGAFTAAAGSTLQINNNFTFDTDLRSEGDVVLDGGTVLFNAGYDVGGLTTFAGSSVTFKVKPARLVSATIGSGTVILDYAEEHAFASLTIDGGTLGGRAPLVVNQFAWSSGDLGGTNSFRIPAGGTWSLPGNGSRDILARTVTLEGTCTFTGSGSLRFRNGSGVHNLGTLDIQGDGDFTHFGGGGILRNSGTFRKSGGTGPTAIGGGMLFTNLGNVDVSAADLEFHTRFDQAEGVTALNGGRIIFNQAASLVGGVLTGSGEVVGHVTNAAAVHPGHGVGQLRLSGNYSQTSSGVLVMELGGVNPGSQYDQLVITNTARLAGTLMVALTNGFVPKLGDRFTLATFRSRVGTFAEVGGAITNAAAVQLEYTDTNVVLEVLNSKPTFPAPLVHAVDEESPVTLTIAALDRDIPAQTLAYALVSAPPRAAINPVTGAITWTPSETDGPGTNTLVLQVTDSGTPALTDTSTITFVVNEVNNPPRAIAPTNLAVNELAPADLIIRAEDDDQPANRFAFELLAGPTGAVLDADTGLVHWTPTEADGPGSVPFIVKVTDTNTNAPVNPRLSVTNSFTVVVGEVNAAPDHQVLADQTVDESAPLSVAVAATDEDLPPNQLFFALVNAPSGMSVSPAGAITWTPTEAQGPSTNRITLQVSDDGTPALTASRQFTVIVREVNAPPVLTAIDDQLASPGETLRLQATAADPDIPANPLTFSLVAAPAGAIIDAATGEFQWTPPESLSGTVQVVTVQVADAGTPAATATESFTVQVGNQFSITSVRPMAGLVLTLVWTARAGQTYRVQTKGNLSETVWADLPGDILATGSTAEKTDPTFGNAAQRFYRVVQLP